MSDIDRFVYISHIKLYWINREYQIRVIQIKINKKNTMTKEKRAIRIKLWPTVCTRQESKRERVGLEEWNKKQIIVEWIKNRELFSRAATTIKI